MAVLYIAAGKLKPNAEIVASLVKCFDGLSRESKAA